MTRSRHSFRRAALAALPALLIASAAPAQESSGGFLGNLFNRGEQQQQQAPQRQFTQGSSDIGARVDRLESALRQLTGTIEELQHQNQQLQMQLQQMGGYRGAAAPNAAPNAAPGRAPVPAAPPTSRGDVFNPAMHPNAPGAPRSLGNEAPRTMNAPDFGAPNGRDAGAPLDLNSLAGPVPVRSQPNGQLPSPPPRNTSATGTQLATLPPSASPKDEYDMAYGYVLHKDYGLAAQAFRDFLRKHPHEGLAPEAQYWLGESLFQQQNYTDAAKQFLDVATKYERSGKAPESLLRLGQSLSALHKKEAACATLAEVGHKFPRASASVKRGVAQEQKRAHC